MPRIRVSSSVRAIDLFAGCGGFTLGAEMAGVRVVWAADYWKTAVQVHAENHPHARHECADLTRYEWSLVPRYELLLASPACQGHSTNSQPHRDERHEIMRNTAWAVVECARQTQPLAFLVENVPPFLKWDAFDSWISSFRGMGYFTTIQIIRASRCGIPQRRDRVIVAGSKTREIPICDLGTNEPPFEPCLDPDGNWKPLSLAGPDARERMRRSFERNGRCLVQHVTSHSGISLSEPIRTITTQAQWCLVEGDRYRWLTPRELARGMSFPDSYKFPSYVSTADRKKLIGNAIPPLLAKTAIEQILN